MNMWNAAELFDVNPEDDISNESDEASPSKRRKVSVPLAVIGSGGYPPPGPIPYEIVYDTSGKPYVRLEQSREFPYRFTSPSKPDSHPTGRIPAPEENTNWEKFWIGKRASGQEADDK